MLFENTGGIIGFVRYIYSNAHGPLLWLSMHVSNGRCDSTMGYRCRFSLDGKRFVGVNIGMQNIVYAVLLITSPAGAWALFAYGTLQSAGMLVMSYLTVNGKWAEVEGVNPTHEGTVVAGLLVPCHLYIMFGMRTLYIRRSSDN